MASKNRYTADEAARTAKALLPGGTGGVDATGDRRVNARDVVAMLKNPAPTSSAAGTATSAVKPVTPDQYASRLAGELGSYLDGSVDVNNSDLYRAYANQRRRESDRSVEDVIGRLAASAGGRVSSFAGSAAQQQANYYNSQLADDYLNIYDRLRGEQADRVSTLAGLENQQYGREYQAGRDAVSDEQWRKQFERLLRRDAVSDEQWNKQFTYNAGRDAVSDAQWEKEFAESSKRYWTAQDWQNAVTAAGYGDYSLLGALGIDTTAYAANKQYADAVDRAITAFQTVGDVSGLEALGIDTTAYKANKQYADAVERAVTAFQTVGDVSGLEALGIDTSAYKENQTYERSQSERAQEYEIAASVYQLTGDTTLLAKYFGIPKATFDAQIAANQAAQVAASGGGSGGGGAASSGGTAKSSSGSSKNTPAKDPEEETTEEYIYETWAKLPTQYKKKIEEYAGDYEGLLTVLDQWNANRIIPDAVADEIMNFYFPSGDPAAKETASVVPDVGVIPFWKNGKNGKEEWWLYPDGTKVKAK